MTKAEAACITWPRVIDPSRNFGAHSKHRDHRRDQRARLRHAGGAPVLRHQLAPPVQHFLQAPIQAGALLLLPAEQRDALAVLAHARERVAVLGFRLVAILRDGDEAISDDHHRDAGEQRIEHGGNDQEAGDMDRGAAEREGVGAADRPQHDDEGGGRQRGRRDTGQEVNRCLGGDLQVVGDAEFRIGMVALDQVELVIAAVGHPVVDHLVVEPLTPAPLHGHAHVDRRHGKADADGREHWKDQPLQQRGVGVAVLERIEEQTVPLIDVVVGDDLGQHDEDQHDGEEPGDVPAALARPVAFRAFPEPADQMAAPRAPCVVFRLIGLVIRFFDLRLLWLFAVRCGVHAGLSRRGNSRGTLREAMFSDRFGSAIGHCARAGIAKHCA